MVHQQLRLRDVAKIVRSKNAGPFRLTLDVIFGSGEAFEQALQSRSLSRKSVSNAYAIEEEQISSFHAIPEMNAVKITLKRPVDQSALGETDVYGCQQHVPLMNIEIVGT